MKQKYILFLLFICFLSPVVAQETISSDPDERLYEVYNDKYLESLSEKNPVLIQRWNYYLDNSFSILPHVAEKKSYESSIEIDNIVGLNILLIEKEIGIRPDYHKKMTYYISNHNCLLVYKSMKSFYKNFNENLQRKHPQPRIQLIKDY